MSYKVNKLEKLKEYGFINTIRKTYSLVIDQDYDKKLGNEYKLNIVVNAIGGEQDDTITINYYTDVQGIEINEESAGCDRVVDVGVIYDLINKMIADGVVSRTN